jgi:hypothetical protein
MPWGGWFTRRRVLVGLLIAFALADAAFASAVMQADGAAPARAALPFHPLAYDFRPNDTQLTECMDTGCFKQAFGNIAYREGPKAALELVDKVYGNGSDPACHSVTHLIGVASLARFRGNVTKTLSEGKPTCWSGYYHGVVERSLVKARSRKPAVLAAMARTMCADDSLTPWVVYGCLHGLGHGLMIATGLQLPVSLEVCSRLDRWWDRDACRGGVFMENISSSYGFTSRFLKEDDPVYPCNWVPRGERRRCYLIATSRILPLVGDDWQRTAEICADVEADYVDECFRSFGRDASTRSGRDAEEIAELCAIARPFGGEGDCVEAAAYDMTANYASAKRSSAFCERMHSRVHERCYYGVGIVLGRFQMTRSARVAACEALVSDAELVAACIRGGRENLPRTGPDPSGSRDIWLRTTERAS